VFRQPPPTSSTALQVGQDLLDLLRSTSRRHRFRKVAHIVLLHMFGQGTPLLLIGELVKTSPLAGFAPLAVAMIVARERRPVSFGLLIDQFEELFTICDDQDSRSAFIDN